MKMITNFSVRSRRLSWSYMDMEYLQCCDTFTYVNARLGFVFKQKYGDIYNNLRDSSKHFKLTLIPSRQSNTN